ncbi:hypothetical protein OBBRIDRAFT_807948 [Obba rivulosa]|uniref:C2H2-type domain-containing protein n=1 Tax=Obba rivulosa TaxID=1052685 RepID=A0A8E2AK54_9APHY|nr:hypothetical protein OBBRIDRAFT_807948 [Obba rivulosa]
MYSPSPSPSLDEDGPNFSDSSSDDDLAPYGEPAELGQSISRPGSPMQAEGQLPDNPNAETDTMTCRWEDCDKVFNHLPTLIDHIHNDHIGVHKSNYTCEWATCSRRGIAQTSRFALISHIRSHTGEKPFTCPRPECDKSFTRSDALAKHMRIQHNISPPLPGRGGNRKRKREETDSIPGAAGQGTSGYNMFKVEQTTPAEFYSIEMDDGRLSPVDASGRQPRQVPAMRPASPDSEVVDIDEEIPPHLMALRDPATGFIMGRSPTMVKYLLMKAKYRYAIDQHEALVEELRTLRYEEKCWKERKDLLLDELLRAQFGPQAEDLALPPVMATQNKYVYRPDIDDVQP